MSEFTPAPTDPTPPVEPGTADPAAAPTEPEPSLVPVPEGMQIPDKFVNDGQVNLTELVKSYGELETAKVAPPVETPPVETPPTDGIDPDEFFAQFAPSFAENGKLTEEQYKEITTKSNGLITQAHVDQYFVGLQAQAQANNQEVYASVGGEQAFIDMTKWVQANLNETQLAAYNAQLDAAANSGDMEQVKVVVQGMNAQFRANTQGSAADFLKGNKIVGANIKPFADFAEMQRAISTPEYQRGDEAAHKLVNQRLSISKI